MNNYRENYYDKMDRIICDWVIPVAGLAIIIAVIVLLIQEFS